MSGDVVGLEERRSALESARDLLEGLDDVVHQSSGVGLAELMGLVDAVAAKAAAARVVITAEALSRGEVSAAGTNALTWVRDHAPSLRQGGAGPVAQLASAATSGGALWNPEGRILDPESPVGIVWSAVRDGVASPSLAMAALREVERLDPHLMPEAKPTVARALLEVGTQWGPTVMRGLRARLLASHGRPGEFDDLQASLAPSARLSAPVVESAAVTEYQLLMTPEQAAALEAAIGPLSAPAPDNETGERDLRPAGQRRVEALTEVCRRSSGLDADRSGADGAGGAASAVHVVIGLADLEAGSGFGEVLGSTATGTTLSIETLRRLSCEADLIPHVLGTDGEGLDLGRVVRLFTRAQRRRLMRRDRGCTFPGCTAPAVWSRAHHVLHWADGGRSDIQNAALLCQRHHTYVHERRLYAQVRQRPDELGRYVAWDLSPNSYDRHLERLRAERSAGDPRPLTPERFRELVGELTSSDWVERKVAEHELHLAALATSPPDEAEPGGHDWRAEYELGA